MPFITPWQFGVVAIWLNFNTIILHSIQDEKKFAHKFIKLLLHVKQEVLGSTNRLLSLLRVLFVTAVTFQPSRCLATLGGFLQSCSLATIGEYTYRHTDWSKGFMKYGAEMSSSAVIYVPSFIQIGSGIQKLIGGIHRQTDRHTHTHSNLIS
jgi:hypothetical protein